MPVSGGAVQLRWPFGLWRGSPCGNRSPAVTAAALHSMYVRRSSWLFTVVLDNVHTTPNTVLQAITDLGFMVLLPTTMGASGLVVLYPIQHLHYYTTHAIERATKSVTCVLSAKISQGSEN